METRLNKTLQQRIKSLDINLPYIWKLKLSEADFNELEDGINVVCATQGPSCLTNDKNAIYTIVYLAEWYKRKYHSGSKNEISEKIDLQVLWSNAGINQKVFLYKDENGNKRWLYSIFVLGGLAIEHELSRCDNRKFIKGLCRLYNGEDYSLENLEDSARAISFRESIKRKHSLYEFMRAILCGQLPFSEDDLNDESSNLFHFISLVKSANEEILKVKFRFEWVVNFSPEYSNMSRKLFVWLKPEEVGGGLHQYLRYDRLHLWGVPHPENKLHIYVYLRFKFNGNVVEPSTMNKPIITFLNHSVNDFVAFGIENCAVVRNVPSCRFNTIEVVLMDDDGNEYLAQRQETTEFLQLWRSQSYSDTWTSTSNSQKDTAVVFTNRCSLLDKASLCDVLTKRFWNKSFGMSESWNWLYIYDSVGIRDSYGKEWRLYNRIGYDQVTTRLYPDIIHYLSGGYIKHYYIDDPDISTESDIEELPLIFGKDDIIVRHFATKDDILNANPDNSAIIEGIEFKQVNGRYQEWNDTEKPSYGKNMLRIRVKGKYLSLSVIFLPSLVGDKPIDRDYKHSQIVYKDINDAPIYIQDSIPKDGNVLFPTLSIKYTIGQDSFEVNVFRPTLIKEVLFDDIIIKYIEGDDFIDLPYILKNRVKINDFSIDGYQSYDCSKLASIYSDTFLNVSGNENSGWAALAAWHDDIKFSGKLLDDLAPHCLNVCFGQSKDNPRWENEEALVWNYDMSESPTICSPSDLPDFGIIFQNFSTNKNLICNYPIQEDDDVWGFDDVSVSIVKCFEVANKYGIYFFLMKPLIMLPERNIVTELYMPLLQLRKGILNNQDIEGLLRFSEEFSFDWCKYNINIENK